MHLFFFPHSCISSFLPTHNPYHWSSSSPFLFFPITPFPFSPTNVPPDTFTLECKLSINQPPSLLLHVAPHSFPFHFNFNHFSSTRSTTPTYLKPTLSTPCPTTPLVVQLSPTATSVLARAACPPAASPHTTRPPTRRLLQNRQGRPTLTQIRRTQTPAHFLTARLLATLHHSNSFCRTPPHTNNPPPRVAPRLIIFKKPTSPHIYQHRHLTSLLPPRPKAFLLVITPPYL
jgi:hypothetical protein